MRISDWSSDVCSSDLPWQRQRGGGGRSAYSVSRDMDFPALRHDDRRDRHAARQWRGGAATDYPVPVDVSDPSRLLLAHLSGARRRCDLVELPALFARLAGDGVGGISARALAAGNAAARRRRLTPCLRALLRSAEHTSELQSLMRISDAVCWL